MTDPCLVCAIHATENCPSCDKRDAYHEWRRKASVGRSRADLTPGEGEILWDARKRHPSVERSGGVDLMPEPTPEDKTREDPCEACAVEHRPLNECLNCVHEKERDLRMLHDKITEAVFADRRAKKRKKKKKAKGTTTKKTIELHPKWCWTRDHDRDLEWLCPFYSDGYCGESKTTGDSIELFKEARSTWDEDNHRRTDECKKRGSTVTVKWKK